MARLGTERIGRINKAIFQLCAFVNGWSKPTEAQLDEWQDEIVGLLEDVNDAAFPDALTPESESPEEPEAG